MQLKKFTNLTGAIATASCALLGTPAVAQDEDSWKFDTALLYYGESDGRVKAVEGILAGKKAFDDGEFLDLKITIDALTGASPTGAVAQPNVQTYTRPSGQGHYQIAPGTTPVDDTFKDTRVQLNGQWTQPLDDALTLSTGAHFSKEYDYMAMGINASLSKDINNKNTTLSAGFSYSYDTISPEGGRPIAFASVVGSGPGYSGEEENNDDDLLANARTAHRFSDDEGQDDEHSASRLNGNGHKDVVDLLLGVTQVINRRMLMQFNYSYSSSDGYLTDPFKMLSVVDGDGITQQLLYENRPDKRTKQSFFWQTKYHFDTFVTDVAYRYMRDDWGINSHTVDTRLRYSFDDGSYLEPHIRFYRQEAADFYRPFLGQNESLPSFASADYRIGAFNAITVGAKYGIPLASGNSMAVRLEYYMQNPDNSGFSKPGVLKNYDLDPNLSALILQFSYSF